MYQQQEYQYHTLNSKRTFQRQSNCKYVSLKGNETKIEIKNGITGLKNENQHIEFTLEPVYVVDRDGESILMYYSRMMVEGEKYFVKWHDEHLALIKEDNEIIIYKRQV